MKHVVKETAFPVLILYSHVKKCFYTMFLELFMSLLVVCLPSSALLPWLLDVLLVRGPGENA